MNNSEDLSEFKIIVFNFKHFIAGYKCEIFLILRQIREGTFEQRKPCQRFSYALDFSIGPITFAIKHLLHIQNLQKRILNIKRNKGFEYVK
jgi:hypothetical protein